MPFAQGPEANYCQLEIQREVPSEQSASDLSETSRDDPSVVCRPDLAMRHRVIACLAGLAAAAIALLIVGGAWLMLGVATHVIAMCSDAPVWWEKTFDALGGVVVIFSLFAGWVAHQALLSRFQRQ